MCAVARTHHASTRVSSLLPLATCFVRTCVALAIPAVCPLPPLRPQSFDYLDADTEAEVRTALRFSRPVAASLPCPRLSPLRA